MNSAGAPALILAGVLTSLAAIAHLGCLFFGASAFRLMGAGERVARAVEAGKLQPIFVTVGIAALLSVWAAYAFSVAGLIGPSPFGKFMLPAISAVFLARAFGFPLLKSAFPENSKTFWWVSSGICLLLGGLYAWGTAAAWAHL